MQSRMRLLIALLFALSCIGRAAEEPPRPAIREVEPGVFEVGKIRLSKKDQTITFPASVNKASADDLLEYLLVNERGQTHESLLFTTVEPADVHAAMLLLGAKGGPQELKPEQQGGGQINDEFLRHAPKLKGDVVQIRVTWKGADGAEKSAPVEDWILNRNTKKPMTRGPWIYNGSTFLEGKFRAQQEGCFGALVTYPPALINNPREGNTEDDIWSANPKAVPALETPVQVVIRLEASAPETPKK